MFLSVYELLTANLILMLIWLILFDIYFHVVHTEWPHGFKRHQKYSCSSQTVAKLQIICAELSAFSPEFNEENLPLKNVSLPAARKEQEVSDVCKCFSSEMVFSSKLSRSHRFVFCKITDYSFNHLFIIESSVSSFNCRCEISWPCSHRAWRVGCSQVCRFLLTL